MAKRIAPIKANCFACNNKVSAPDCTILNETLCAIKGKCPFYKTEQEALASVAKSARRRENLGFALTDAEKKLIRGYKVTYAEIMEATVRSTR